MNNLIIAAVPITLLDHIFPKCISQLERVVEKAPNDISVETIKNDLYNGRTMLVTVSDGPEIVAVNILHPTTYDTGHKILFIPIIGGNRLSEWKDRFLSIAHAMARDLKCDELRGMACREGWLKVLKEDDWYPVHTVIGCKVKQIEEVA